ncbi:cell wall hydrolase [Sphingomonas sp.]|uniref:cell wall hydrolase n=1 Tax=Sphingomonas sp. TaxID=28214 RepID=UPI0035BBF8C6
MPAPSKRVGAALVAVAAAAVTIPALVVTHPPAKAKRAIRPAKLPPRRVVPQAELPPVEPVKLVDLAPDDARAFNETVPFSTLPNPAARPFRFAGSAEDRERATDCLAAGVLYEAGDDSVGERAVAQVVLNRLRHPAFPKTVCGVVFEGSERTTGCQFTFTCDGALTRWKPSEAGWKRAREVAGLALSGAVYKPVGYSTHYHTDWVVPYWQSSLDKVARVGSHLFFRWSGWWGTPPAFNRQVATGEPAVAALAGVSPAHGMAAALAQGDAAVLAVAAYTGTVPVALPSDPDTFVVALDPKAAPDSYKAMALAACADRPHCVVMGWTDRALMPVSASLLPNQSDAMGFSYLRNREGDFERALWNCATFPRAVKTECMRRQVLRIEAPVAAPVVTAPAAEPLAGVRRKGEAIPSPTAAPAAK